MTSLNGAHEIAVLQLHAALYCCSDLVLSAIVRMTVVGFAEGIDSSIATVMPRTCYMRNAYALLLLTDLLPRLDARPEKR